MNISSVTSGASAWLARTSGPPDGAERAQQRFAKVDADGSGGVDATELQTVLDKLSEKTGTSLGKAEDRFAAMDSDGDGSLSSTELDSGIQSLMPEPASTLEFAQRMGGGPGGAGGTPPPPPPQGGASGEDGAGSTASADALDTNGDGVVSMQERMAGEMSDMLQAVMQAGDSDGDGALSSTEVDTLTQKLGAALEQMLGGATSAAAASGTAGGAADGQASGQDSSSSDDAVSKLAQMLLREYAPPPMAWQSSSFSVAA